MKKTQKNEDFFSLTSPRNLWRKKKRREDTQKNKVFLAKDVGIWVFEPTIASSIFFPSLPWISYPWTSELCIYWIDLALGSQWGIIPEGMIPIGLCSGHFTCNLVWLKAQTTRGLAQKRRGAAHYWTPLTPNQQVVGAPWLINSSLCPVWGLWEESAQSSEKLFAVLSPLGASWLACGSSWVLRDSFCQCLRDRASETTTAPLISGFWISSMGSRIRTKDSSKEFNKGKERQKKKNTIKIGVLALCFWNIARKKSRCYSLAHFWRSTKLENTYLDQIIIPQNVFAFFALRMRWNTFFTVLFEHQPNFGQKTSKQNDHFSQLANTGY